MADTKLTRMPGGVATFLPPSSIVGADTLEEGVKWWNGPEGDAGFLARGAEDEDPPDIRYVGLEFSAEDGLHYGYVGLRFIYNSTFLLERAWETEPGKPITVPVPEPSGAALGIAAGVLALGFRRGKR